MLSHNNLVKNTQKLTRGHLVIEAGAAVICFWFSFYHFIKKNVMNCQCWQQFQMISKVGHVWVGLCQTSLYEDFTNPGQHLLTDREVAIYANIFH